MMSQRGFFAIGIVKGVKWPNIGTLARSAYSMGASFMFTVGGRYQPQASDTPKSWRHMPIMEFGSVSDLVDHLPYGCPLVGVENSESALPLALYRHPMNACYLLGSEDNGLNKDDLALCHEVVILPGIHCLNVAVAGSIVMADRLVQMQRRITANQSSVSAPQT